MPLVGSFEIRWNGNRDMARKPDRPEALSGEHEGKFDPDAPIDTAADPENADPPFASRTPDAPPPAPPERLEVPDDER